MKTFPAIFLLLAAAFLMSLGSCVNEVKNIPQETLSRLSIVFVPDSNSLLKVKFHAAMTPTWQKHYRLDWTFGDSTGVISKFDTSGLDHYYQNFDSYLVTLSVFDTIAKVTLGRTSLLVDLKVSAFDTNYLHSFTKIKINLSCSATVTVQQHKGGIIDTFTRSSFSLNFGNSLNGHSTSSINWNGPNFSVDTSTKDSYSSLKEKSKTSELYIYQGSISNVMNGSCFSNYAHSQSGLSVGYQDDSISQSLTFNSIPVLRKKTDSLVFILNDATLQSHISSIYYYDLNKDYDYQTTILQTVLWDKLPSAELTITFYK
jgi:hypothetical protein